jgi:nucleotide-binding universal stress UspA family protein
MEEIYRILIPTDYSETADYALDMGITFAKRANAEVHLFHNEDIPPDWVAIVEKDEGNMYDMVKDQLGLVKDQLSDRLTLGMDSGAKVESFLEYNKGYRAILGHAENYEIDLIVMGAHGHTGLKGLLMGSYTQKVLHHSIVPVFVTKFSDAPNDLRKVVFVSDFQPEHSESLLNAIAFAQHMRSEIEVLFINTPSNFKDTDDIHNRIDQYIEKAPKGIIEKIGVVNAYHFESGLAKYCEKNDIDIIAMPIYKKRHSWDVMGTTIEDVINNIDIPVLGLPVEN